MNIFRILLLSIFLVLSTGLLNIASAASDGRRPIVLTEDQRNFVLEEMRTFLDTVRTITLALSKDDMQGITEAAQNVGMTASGSAPAELRNKLPQDFRAFAMNTHKGFDLIALDAIELEDRQHTLEQLGTLMSNCVSCHTIFRLDIENTDSQ